MSRKRSVTVLGLGEMGTSMAANFVRASHPTTVWNRTPGKAEPLVEQGAVLAATAAQAVTTSELVIISQVDIAAMYDSLVDVDDLTGKTLVNLSSGTPEQARDAAEWVRARGGSLVAAGIMVPAAMIGEPGAYSFYSGDEGAFAAYATELKVLGDTVYLGADHGLSQLYYQAQLNVFWAVQAAMFQSAALFHAEGRTAMDLVKYLDSSVDLARQFLEPLAQQIDQSDHRPAGANLHMQVVGAEHVLKTMRAKGIDTTLPAALHELFDRADTAGHGKEGLTAVTELIKTPHK